MPRRALVVLRAGPRRPQQIAPIGPAGQPPVAMRFAFDAVRHEYAMVPTSAALSKDGAFLAFLRGGRPMVRQLETGAETALVTGRMGDGVVSYSGWSPREDSVVYTLGTRDGLDTPVRPRMPAPEGVYAAAVSLANNAAAGRPARASVRADVRRLTLPEQSTPTYWASDEADTFLYVHHVAQYHDELRRVTHGNNAARTVYALRGGFWGISQWHVRGNALVFVHRPSSAARGAETITAVRLDERAPALRSLSTGDVLNAGPELSVDGSQVLWHAQDGGQRAVWVAPFDGSARARAIYRCTSECWARWESNASLFVVDSGALQRVFTDGRAPVTVVARDVELVIVEGGA